MSLGCMVGPHRLLPCWYSFRPLLLPSPPPSCTSLQTSRMMNVQCGQWLWPADRETQIFDACDRHGTRKSILGFTCNTAKPLPPSLVTQALTHLQWRMPNLQTVLRRRGDTLWHYQPSTPVLDFKVVGEDEGDLTEICTKVAQQNFSYSDDAFWRVWLVPRSAHVPCPIPELRAAYPHQYDIALHIHHGIGDGMDEGLSAWCFSHVLKKLLAGEVVDDTPWGIYTSKEDVEALKKEVKQKLFSNPERTDAVRLTLPPPHQPLLLPQLGPKPQVSQPSSRHCICTIEQEVVARFVQKAKDEGITFNSAIAAAINTALVDLAREAGLDQDSFTITLGLNVTLRRYLPKSDLHRIGPYNSHMTFHGRVSKDVKNMFWEYAKQLHQELRLGIGTRLSLEQAAVRNKDQPELSPEEAVVNPGPHLHDYGFITYGNLESFFEKNGEDIWWTKMFSYSYVHCYVWSNLHQVLIDNGQIYYTMSYDTQHLTDDTAARFMDQVASVIRHVSYITTPDTATRSKM